MNALFLNITSAVFAGGGIYLAATGKEAWSWCFICAILCHCTPSGD